MNYKIFCINLDIRPDRLEKMKNTFKLLNIEDKINYHIVKKNNNVADGCYRSHYECLLNFLKDDSLDYIIIFEDDCNIDKDDILWEKIIKDIEYFFSSKYDYGFFSVGCSPSGLKMKKLGNGIIETMFLTSLCYAIKKEEFLKLQNNLEKYLNTNTHIDIFYINFIENQIGYEYPIFYQNLLDSDNKWTELKNIDAIPRHILELSRKFNMNNSLIFKIGNVFMINNKLNYDFNTKNVRL